MNFRTTGAYRFFPRLPDFEPELRLLFPPDDDFPRDELDREGEPADRFEPLAPELLPVARVVERDGDEVGCLVPGAVGRRLFPLTDDGRLEGELWEDLVVEPVARGCGLDGLTRSSLTRGWAGALLRLDDLRAPGLGA